MSDETPGFGTSLIDCSIIESLKKLWEGDLSPKDLDRVELGIRAFLTSPRLVLSRVRNPWRTADHNYSTVLPLDWEEPFSDHLLDYEFEDPYRPVPHASIDKKELGHLEKYISTEVRQEAFRALPGWVAVEGEALAFFDYWYEGYSIGECESYARTMGSWDDHLKTLNKEELMHPVLMGSPVEDAKYLVSCHRAGLNVYSDSPIGKICNAFIFSEWPNKLFDRLGDEYRVVLREIRGPGIAVDLPPLTALLLSRTNNREEIPSVLRELREEYEQSRRQLWDLLEHMWLAERVEEQVDISRKLKDAASSIFKAAFPSRYDVLSLGLDLAQLSRSGLVSAAKALREHDKPKAKVAAVSLAAKLSKDMRKQLLNARTLLRRHLDEWELREFGMD